MKIAVASGKGGTGKTTVAVALAKVLGSCAFIDCDVEAPNAYLFLDPQIVGSEQATIMIPAVDESKCNGCRECSRVCQFNALAVFETSVLLFPEMCHGCGGCVMVCEPGALTESERTVGTMQWGRSGTIDFYEARLRIGEPMSPPLIKAVKQKAAGTSEKDVILDCPPGTTCPMIEAIGGSDYCILVTEPTPFGLHDLQMAAGATEHLGIPAGVIINKADLGDDRVHRYCRDKGLPVLLEIPHSRAIAETIAKGRDILEVMPGLEDSLKQVLSSIAGRAAA